jgi:hypothetical protein
MYGDEKHAGSTYNPPIFIKLDAWSDGINALGDYFEIKRPTNIVIAPGSDMPYCALKYHPNEPAAGDGWPAQAANPAAYVSLMDTNQEGETSDRNTWHPILISHIPTLLQPGWYINALPQMAYVGDQWDIDHAWSANMFSSPEVVLMESNFPVEIQPYQFTTVAHAAGAAVTYYTPWLLSPVGSGLVAAKTNLTYSKLMGFGGSNRTGTGQTAVCTASIYTKCRTYADGAAARNYQDAISITAIANNGRVNESLERFVWFKLVLDFDQDVGATPAGVGYIIF